MRGQVERLVDAEDEPRSRAAQAQVQAGRCHRRPQVCPPRPGGEQAPCRGGPAGRDHHGRGADHLRVGVHLPGAWPARHVLHPGMPADLRARCRCPRQQRAGELLPASVEIGNPADGGAHLADGHRCREPAQVPRVGGDPDPRLHERRRVIAQPERADPVRGTGPLPARGPGSGHPADGAASLRYREAARAARDQRPRPP